MPRKRRTTRPSPMPSAGSGSRRSGEHLRQVLREALERLLPDPALGIGDGRVVLLFLGIGLGVQDHHAVEMLLFEQLNLMVDLGVIFRLFAEDLKIVL